MPDEMGTFRIDIELKNPSRPGGRAVVQGVLVDTGAELSWIPAGILESLGVERRKRSVPAGQRDHPGALDRFGMDLCGRDFGD